MAHAAPLAQWDSTVLPRGFILVFTIRQLDSGVVMMFMNGFDGFIFRHFNPQKMLVRVA